MIFNLENEPLYIAYLQSKVANVIFEVLCPTLKFEVGQLQIFPITNFEQHFLKKNLKRAEDSIELSTNDWDSRETSWDFQKNEMIRVNKEGGIETLEEAYDHYKQHWQNKFYQLHQNEEELNRQFIEIYGLQDELTPDVPLDEISILQEETRIKNGKLEFDLKEVLAQLVSYAVGCMFGRYSLDKPGLILANQGETLSDYTRIVKNGSEVLEHEPAGNAEQVAETVHLINGSGGSTDRHPEPANDNNPEITFWPDDANIIPILDDEWFEDDIVSRFHEFLKVSFGAKGFPKSLSYLEEHLGKDLRRYFVRDFYKDHVSRYKKRPIYWKFTSPKGYFSVLIYMHRYTPDTLNNILNNYLREFVEKLKTRKEHMQHLENTGLSAEKTKATKEIDKLNEMIQDCQTYEREILYPLASERIQIDLDDGVLVNYNLFGQAVEEIKGVNDPKTKAKVKGFDWIDGSRVR